jgi:hypothetical protein
LNTAKTFPSSKVQALRDLSMASSLPCDKSWQLSTRIRTSKNQAN